MFRFELRPLADVPPWGGERPKLHWFGLTSGWYWVELPDGEFLRYHDDAVRRWALERPYPSYYVVRFWEDLLVLRWALEEPVPEDLLSFVDGSFGAREFPEDDDWMGDDRVDAAFDLKSDYLVDFGYLTDSPILRAWRHTVDGRDVVVFSQEIRPAEERTLTGRLDGMS
ncbi:DUF5984 family protein [Paractinoplanes durhamensis]|uniref:DUF5984 family protein n=1 Tax=Paractinoplanes durhamensis TaxID=113563 RepID=UPI003624C376